MFSPASSSFLHKRGVARLAIGVIDPQAWVIDDTGQAKEGDRLGVRGSAVLRDFGTCLRTGCPLGRSRRGHGRTVT